MNGGIASAPTTAREESMASAAMVPTSPASSSDTTVPLMRSSSATLEASHTVPTATSASTPVSSRDQSAGADRTTRPKNRAPTARRVI